MAQVTVSDMNSMQDFFDALDATDEATQPKHVREEIEAQADEKQQSRLAGWLESMKETSNEDYLYDRFGF